MINVKCASYHAQQGRGLGSRVRVRVGAPGSSEAACQEGCTIESAEKRVHRMTAS